MLAPYDTHLSRMPRLDIQESNSGTVRQDSPRRHGFPRKYVHLFPVGRIACATRLAHRTAVAPCRSGSMRCSPSAQCGLRSHAASLVSQLFFFEATEWILWACPYLERFYPSPESALGMGLALPRRICRPSMCFKARVLDVSYCTRFFS
jgi:hypothetical protein